MKRKIVKSDRKPMQKSLPVRPIVTPARMGNWLSFSYSHSEISTASGQTRIRSRKYRFENGKLDSEAFDGTLDAAVYREAIDLAQKLVQAQMSDFLGLFSAFLPPVSRDKDK